MGGAYGSRRARTSRRAYGARVGERERAEAERRGHGLGAAEDLLRGDPLWPGQAATLAALLLYLALPAELTIGPNWPVPVAAGLVLVALVMAARGGRAARRQRRVAIALVVVATVANLVALGFLAAYLVEGGQVRGADLVGGGVIIWTVSLLLFTVLYWELDRGGPHRPGTRPSAGPPDFLFVQMSDPRYAPHGWAPGFADYLFVSLTNQTAFSPTDTMPLTPRIKLLMGIQAVAAFVTVGVVLARAVNVLA
jgi:uncharacterized membrane protein